MEVFLNRLCHHGHHLRVHGAGVILQAQQSIDDQCDEKGRPGGVHHGLDVVEQVGLRHGGRQIGGVGHRRHLIAQIGAGNDGAGRHGGVDAQAHADAHKRHADGACGRPRAADGDGDDRGDKAGRQKEYGGVYELQPPIDDHGHRAAGDPGRHHAANGHHDDGGLDTNLAAIVNGIRKGLPLVSIVEIRHQERHADGEQQVDMDGNIQPKHRRNHGAQQEEHTEHGSPKGHLQLFIILIRHIYLLFSVKTNTSPPLGRSTWRTAPDRRSPPPGSHPPDRRCSRGCDPDTSPQA